MKELPTPVPQGDEVLISVLKAGICNTDLELARGYMDFEGVPGHEFVGRVVKAADAKWQGRRVTGEINIACQECELCQSGKEKHCPFRKVLGIHKKNGAFAEYLTIPLRNLHLIPQGVTDAEAVFVEPLASSLQILKQVHIGKGDSVLILGDGKLALLAAQVIQERTDRVFCLGKHRRKLTLLEKRGIRTSLKGQDLRGTFDIVIEATGKKEGIREALAWVKPFGKIVLKSTYKGEVRIDISQIVVDELMLIGSRCGPFPEAIAMLREKRVNVVEMIDGDFPLEKALEAFSLAEKPETIKVLITP